ncbi:hypothetical protein POTOM_059386 [Populus tomentosa]|uniref:Uncharacterized protein n=1 Tax=Populus tomentosa TaxID=118781 RepID=A0A8X8C221_POPTO|nr:hypothetical protein POTOM_059386 [Populus tomentosa]
MEEVPPWLMELVREERYIYRVFDGAEQTNTADMLDEALEYVKFLQRQIQGAAERALDNLDIVFHRTTLEAFAQPPDLTILYLSRNKLIGAVPYSLKENSNSGWLQFSLDGNLDLFKMDACEKKQQSLLVLVIASVISVSMLLLLSIIAIFWRLKRREFFLNLRYHMIP